MLLHDFLEQARRRLGDKAALLQGGARFTYAELDDQANQLARALGRRGVARGDRVAILGDPCPESVIAIWAALKANAVFMVLSPQTKAEKLAYVLADSGARALLGPKRLHGALAGAADRAEDLRTILLWGEDPADPAGEKVERWEEALAFEPATPPGRRAIDLDLASIIYTSGSTGEPKGVMLTHANMIAAATSITAYLEAREDDVVLSALPLAFDYGLYQILMAAKVGATVVLERGFAFPSAALDAMVREGVTVFPGVPTMFAILAQMRVAEHDLSRVRCVTSTAAALPPAHIEEIRRVFPRARLFSMYGLTECKRCSYLPPEDLGRKPGSVGIAIPNTELWIEGPGGERLGPGQVGQLVVRGSTVMRGYWRKAEATRERLRPGPLPGEQVLYTGDLCRMDEDGYLYFVARMDDMIKCRGEKVAPREIEDVLYALPGVREAAVIGVPDPILGHAVKAFVALDPRSSLTEAQILAYCKLRLEPLLVPKRVEIRGSLPRTDTGKIKKTGLA